MSTNNKAIDIEAPIFPESVADATVEWYVKEGDYVVLDQPIVGLETDKVILEVVATAPGQITNILEPEGAVVQEKAILGKLTVGEVGKTATPSEVPTESKSKVAETVSTEPEQPRGLAQLFGRGPAARRAAQENKQEVIQTNLQTQNAELPSSKSVSHSTTRRVPMTRLRAKIAERLVAVQQESATLTTFNEINLKAVMELRNRYKDKFEKQHGIRLGFMSLFTKATVEALKQFPEVNASIEENDIVYHDYYDISIAVSTDRGLIVPVIRNADQLNLSQIEKTIYEYGQRARTGKISIDELNGGTFTITNGGVFGSLLSTPILNPPQSGILGMHKIEERPIVENGEVVICPMMYVALSYDHRIIDGKESVQFLSTIKNLLEDPTRFLLDI